MALASLALLALSLIGTATKAVGQYSEARNAQRISEYNSAVAVANAKLTMAGARLDLKRGRRAKSRFLSRQRVAFLKSGVTSEGTPFDQEVETASEIELDLQIDFFNARVAANRQLQQSEIDLLQAKGFKTQKIIRPILTGASGVSRAFQSGLFSKKKDPNETK